MNKLTNIVSVARVIALKAVRVAGISAVVLTVLFAALGVYVATDASLRDMVIDQAQGQALPKE